MSIVYVCRNSSYYFACCYSHEKMYNGMLDRFKKMYSDTARDLCA